MNHHNHRESSIEHRESSYLRAYKAPVICPLPTVLGPLHLSRGLYKSAHFIQNKPNFQNARMNVTIFTEMAYENIYNWTLGENKPKQTQFQITRQKRNNGTFYAAHPT